MTDPIKLSWTEKKTNLSNLCGHTSFFLLGASYLTTDILSLRELAMGGISLSIIFQYYRPIPLWIPIRWNALFLLINGVMVASLIEERRLAHESLSEQHGDEKRLFNEEFHKMGFTEVEFYRLMSCAKKKTVPDRFVFCTKNKNQSHMYFIINGDVAIKQSTVDSDTIAIVRRYVGKRAKRLCCYCSIS